MNKSESIANLAQALVKFQKQMPKVKFDSKNPFLGNRYAGLGAVAGAAFPALSAFGLSVSQFPVGENGQVGVTSILMHESGEWLEETIVVPVEEKKGISTNQSAGVSITYLRRYALVSILGLVADEDNDGDDGSAADKAAENILKTRSWTSEQSEAVSVLSLDAGSPMTAEEAVEVLNYSALPENAPIKTVQSWFKRYLTSEGKSVMEKSADANNAYIEARKSGGKKS